MACVQVCVWECECVCVCVCHKEMFRISAASHGYMPANNHVHVMDTFPT